MEVSKAACPVPGMPSKTLLMWQIHPQSGQVMWADLWSVSQELLESPQMEWQSEGEGVGSRSSVLKSTHPIVRPFECLRSLSIQCLVQVYIIYCYSVATAEDATRSKGHRY